MASGDAKAIPLKNAACRVTFAITDADGDLVTGATGLDSEVSGDGGTFADCTNEATEIATASGMYYLDLTSSEMNYDTVAIIVKTSSTGAKTTPIVLYPISTTAAVIGANLVNIAGSAVSTSTAQLGVNAVQISGDSTTADNVQSQYDGTGLTGATYPARQDQISTINVGAASISTTSESFTLTTGTVAAGTYASTAARDASYHQLQDSAGTLDAYYQFDVGADGVPVNVTIFGRVNSSNDNVNVYGYNWGGSAWQQIGSITGNNGSTDAQSQFALYTSHVGTGANLGKVRVRLGGTGLTSSNTYVDQIYCSYSVVRRTIGYQDGAVWLDTVNGIAGTTLWTHGVADYPANTLANAITIATALGVKRLRVVNGSALTLAQSMAGWTIIGDAYTLALNSQNIGGASITGAHITGVSSGSSSVDLQDCDIGTSTLPPFAARDCYFLGTVTMANTSSDYFALHCGDGVSGSGSAQFTFAANCNLHCQNWSGGITLNSMAAGCTFEMGGRGALILAASCTGGTVDVRGCFVFTNSGSGMTVTDSARWGEDQNVTNVTGSVASVTGLTAANLDTTISSRLAPTVGGRTLDVSATGEAGVDWANVGTPGSSVNLSATTISTGQAIGTVAGAVGSVSGNVGGNVAGSVASVVGAVGSVTGNVGGNIVGDVQGDVWGDVGTVSGVNPGAIAATSFAVGAITASAIATNALTSAKIDSTFGAEIADAVWDEDMTAHVISESAGAYQQAAGSSAPTAAQVADAVWDEARAGHVGVGSFGEGVNLLNGGITSAKVDTGVVVGTATATGARIVTLTALDAVLAPISDARIDIFDGTNTTLQLSGTTNPSGVLVINLDDASYVLRVTKSGVTFDANLPLTVAGDTALQIDGVADAVSAASAPDLCVIFGTLRDAGGFAANGAAITATAYALPQELDANELTSATVTETANSSGYFEMELLRGARVNIICTVAGINWVRTVPDAASQDISAWTA